MHLESRLRPLASVLILLLLTPVSFLSRVAGEDDLALGVRTTEPLSGEEQRTKFKLPPGFEIQLVATEPQINKPMNLAFDATGRLWVTTSIEYPWAAPTNHPGRDRVMIFEDFAPDGRARKVTQFADGLNIPIGIYPFRSPRGGRDPATPPGSTKDTWKAIVWSIPNIWLLEDTDGDGVADRREALYGPFDYSRDTHGNQASFRRGFDGWLYCTHGFNNDSHVTARDGSHVDLNSGNTYRIRLDGSRIEQHTHGQVNPFGLAWDARGNLYSTDCHSAPIYQLLDGGWYPSFGKPDDGLGFAPVMLEHAHGSTAIDGAFYYNDDLWPAEFQDTFLIGNVMTSRLNRDRITFLGSTPKAIEQPDFLTSSDPWFRPVDTTLGPDGALYIADFYNRIIGHYEVPLKHPGRDRERGRIWRVVYTNTAVANGGLRPISLPPELPGLIQELASPNLTRRLLAMSDLQDRYGASAAEAVRSALTVPVNPFQTVHSLWLLHRLGNLSLAEWTAATGSPEALVRVHAQRIGADILYQADRKLGVSPDVIGSVQAGALRALSDSDALVQRCAVEALGSLPGPDSMRPLLDLLARVPADDTHLRYVIRRALRAHLADDRTGPELLSRTGWSDADIGVLTDVALAVKTPASGAFVIRNLDRLKSGDSRMAPAIEYAARYAPEAELSRVAAYAREKFSDNLNFRLSLFTWMQSGLAERGLELPPEVKAWGAELALQALDSLDANTLAWSSAPVEKYRNMAPWKYEDRTASDGTRLRVLSSLPLRESFTGILRSPVFAAPRQLTFWLCGHDGPPGQPAQGKNRVRLIAAPQPGASSAGKLAPKPIADAAPPRNDVAQRVTWDLQSVEGQPVYLELVDADAGDAYAWVALGPVDPPVLTLPAVPPAEVMQRRGMAADLAGKLRLTALAPRLRQILDDPSAGLPDRFNAARALAILEPGPTADRLVAILNDGTQSDDIREEMGRAVAEIDTDAARAALVGAMKTAPTRTQVRWATGLASRREGAEALLRGVQDGVAPARILQIPDVWNRLKSSLSPDGLARAEALTRDLPPPDADREKLVAARRNGFAAGDANAAEGQRIFEVNCLLCHQLEGRGGLVGPQLTGIGNRGVERLCEDILDPNRNVDHAFRQTLVVLRDGESRAGLFRREDGDLLVFADAAGQEFALTKSDVAERRELEQSLMPENFGETIPASDFNHLLAYLLAQRGK